MFTKGLKWNWLPGSGSRWRPRHTHTLTHTFSLSLSRTDADLIKTVHTRRRCKFQGLGEEEDVRVWSEKVSFGVDAEQEMKSFQYLPPSLPLGQSEELNKEELGDSGPPRLSLIYFRADLSRRGAKNCALSRYGAASPLAAELRGNWPTSSQSVVFEEPRPE